MNARRSWCCPLRDGGGGPGGIRRRRRRLQPVLVDLDLDRVGIATAIVRPDVALAEADAVERLGRQARTVVGQLLGVGEGAAEPLDHPGMAADVPGRPYVPRRRG